MGHTVYLPTYPPIKRYNYDILLLNHVSLKIYFCFFMFVYRCVFMVVCVKTHIKKRSVRTVPDRKISIQKLFNSNYNNFPKLHQHGLIQ